MCVCLTTSRFSFVVMMCIVITDSVESLKHQKGDVNPRAPSLPSNQQVNPRVDALHSGNVSTLLGKTASLRCRILDRGNTTVSWIRHRDLHLLTVDQYTYTSDQRFQTLYESSTGDWILIIRSVQLRDRGIYECQIGTTPPISHFVTLHIEEPRTEILGGGDLHINIGSTINLTCLVLYHAKPPHSLIWLHEGKEVHYNSARGGVTVLTEAGEITRSNLLIQKATVKDAGNYICLPTGAANVTARVHVLNEEHQAAMQGRAGTNSIPKDNTLLYSVFLILFANLPNQLRDCLTLWWMLLLVHAVVHSGILVKMFLWDLLSYLES